jgi:hypothetical protein
MRSSNVTRSVDWCQSQDRILYCGIALAVAFAPGCGGRAAAGSSPADAATVDAANYDALDTTTCTVLASEYDQSCSVNTDCMSVGEVQSCPATQCAFCMTGTINRGVASNYMKAFSSATANVPLDAGTCNCGAAGPPCCRSGKCQACY